MNLIDSHCHLYSLSNVKDAIIQARDAGITKAVVVSENLQTMEQTLKLRDAFPEFVLPGLGIHPVDVLSMSHNEWEKSLSFLKIHAPEASCIGEIGLDYKYATRKKDSVELFMLRWRWRPKITYPSTFIPEGHSDRQWKKPLLFIRKPGFQPSFTGLPIHKNS
jgi:Tat protein secretion system quality control protein TatD with DNase activity